MPADPPLNAVLLHLSYNMWGDFDRPGTKSPYYTCKPYLRFDETLWRDLLERMSGGGLNAVVLDLGDGVRYASHPEIAVEGAWTPAKLREELKRMRDLGIEPIPKLNFSAAHDTWLGPHTRMVSTPKYYEVTRELIAEICDLFDGPRLFHIGMDEELAKNQKNFEFVIVRQYGLWWRDLEFFVGEVEKHEARAWMWSDYVWDHPELFYERMPRTILQSNWYYGVDFSPEVPAIKAYLDLEAHGFDQVPTLANWHTADNIYRTVEFARKHIPPQRLKGFLLAPWRPTLEECRERLTGAVDHFARALNGEPAPVGQPAEP